MALDKQTVERYDRVNIRSQVGCLINNLNLDLKMLANLVWTTQKVYYSYYCWIFQTIIFSLHINLNGSRGTTKWCLDTWGMLRTCCAHWGSADTRTGLMFDNQHNWNSTPKFSIQDLAHEILQLFKYLSLGKRIFLETKSDIRYIILKISPPSKIYQPPFLNDVLKFSKVSPPIC